MKKKKTTHTQNCKYSSCKLETGVEKQNCFVKKEKQFQSIFSKNFFEYSSVSSDKFSKHLRKKA